MANQIFKELSAPIVAQWEVTPNCNYNCVYCYNYWRDKKTPANYNSKKDVDKLMKKTVKEIIKNKIFSLVITGGEPLLVIDKILPYAKELSVAGVYLNLNTNLSLATPQIIKKIKSAGIFSILTSLPSCVPETNDSITQSKQSLERTVRGIKISIKNGIIPAVNMVVSKKNIHDIYKTAKFVKSLGVEHFSASKAAQPLNCPDFNEYALSTEQIVYMITELVRIKKELKMDVNSLIVMPDCFLEGEVIKKQLNISRHCTAGKTVSIIGFDGNIRACLHMSKNYGNINSGLKKAWKAMNEDWRTDKFLPKQCQNCSIKTVCGGGCKAEALTHGGKLSSPDPLTDFSRIFKKQVIKRRDYKKSPDFKFYEVNSNARYREEIFGGCIISNYDFTPLQSPLYQFLLNKKMNKQRLTIKDISNILKCSQEDAKDTINFLLTKSIIIGINK